MNAPISETSQKKLLRALRAYVIKEWACNREEQGVSLHSSLTFPLDCSFSLSTSLNYGTWGNLLCRRIQPVSLHSSLTFPVNCSFSLSTSLNCGTWGNLLCGRIHNCLQTSERIEH